MCMSDSKARLAVMFFFSAFLISCGTVQPVDLSKYMQLDAMSEGKAKFVIRDTLGGDALGMVDKFDRLFVINQQGVFSGYEVCYAMKSGEIFSVSTYKSEHCCSDERCAVELANALNYLSPNTIKLYMNAWPKSDGNGARPSTF